MPEMLDLGTTYGSLKSRRGDSPFSDGGSVDLERVRGEKSKAKYQDEHVETAEETLLSVNDEGGDAGDTKNAAATCGPMLFRLRHIPILASLSILGLVAILSLPGGDPFGVIVRGKRIAAPAILGSSKPCNDVPKALGELQSRTLAMERELQSRMLALERDILTTYERAIENATMELKANMEELEEDSASKSKIIAKLESKVAELEGENASKGKALARLEDLVAKQADAMSTRYEGVIENTTMELKEDMEELEEDSASIIAKLESKVAELEVENASKGKALTRLEELVAKQADAMSTRYEGVIENTTTELKEDMEELEEDSAGIIAKLDSKVAELEVENASKGKALTRLEELFAKHADAISILEANAANKTNAFIKLKADVAMLDEENVKKSNAVAKLEADNASKSNAVAKLVADVAVLNQGNTDKANDMARLKTEVNALQTKADVRSGYACVGTALKDGLGQRSKSVAISFHPPFMTIPSDVTFALSMADMDHTRNLRISFKSKDCTKNGCTIVATTWWDTRFYNLCFAWVATAL